MSTISIKCPNCGGELIFDPKSQKYKCEYCGSDFALDEIGTEDTKTQETLDSAQTAGAGSDSESFEETASGDSEGADQTTSAVVYTCPSCGAQIVTDQTTAATFCYYCHNPVLLSEQLTGEFHPDQIEKLTGIYFPYWVYDAEVDGALSAEGSKIRVWVAGDEEITETKIFRMEREGRISLNEITKHALKKSDQVLAEGVLPYDFSKAEPFHMGYLSGFYAEKRDIEYRELQDEVQNEVEGYTRDMLEDTIQGYTGVHILSDHIRMVDEHWSYTLLPVWTVTYKGPNGKIYYYSMNGQNGKTFGELPIDRKKVLSIGILIGAIVFVIMLIVGYLFFS